MMTIGEAATEAADQSEDPPFLSRERMEGESLMTLDVDQLRVGGVATLSWSPSPGGPRLRRSFRFKEGDLLIVLTAEFGGPAGYWTICLGEENPYRNYNHRLQIPDICAVFMAHTDSNIRSRSLPTMLRRFLGGQASQVNKPDTWPRLMTYEPRGKMPLLWEISNAEAAEALAV